MSGFKTPLPRLLADTLTHALNEMMRVDTSGQVATRMAILEGHSVALCLSGAGINLVFSGADGLLRVHAMTPAQFDAATVDTTITGTPEALLALAVPDWVQAKTAVRIEGDAQVAQALEQLMRQLNPDWEALLVERFGMVIGHQLHGLFRALIESTRQGTEVGMDQLSQYLRHESGWLIDRQDFETFTHAIDDLQEAIDRLAVNAARRGLL